MENQRVENSTEIANMNPENLKYFVIGLKQAIKQSEWNQKDFVDGITTEVNLSKVLNFKSGTSREMRVKMAQKLGMDVLDIVMLGKVLSNGEPVVKPSTKPEVFPVWTKEELEELPPSTLMEEVAEYGSFITDSFNRSAELVSKRATALAVERNRILRDLREIQAVTESIDSMLKVNKATPECELLYRNAAYVRHVGWENAIVGAPCPRLCGRKEDCYVDLVKATGKSHEEVRKHGDIVFSIRASPIFEHGKVTKVATVITDITIQVDRMAKNGGPDVVS